MVKRVPRGLRSRRAMTNPKSSDSAPTTFLSACKATQIAEEGFIETIDDPTITNKKPNTPAFHNPGGFALLVGINTYGKINNLRGCLNDVNNMKNILLERFGWSSDRIRVLTDDQATRDGIIQGLLWLVAQSKAGTPLVFTFSGHGSWTLIPEGRGWECCICCANCVNDWDSGVISRTQFNDAIQRPAGKLTVLLDSCFSGGMFPSYRSWHQLPAKVRIYRSFHVDRTFQEVRALPGPEWETIETASKRLNIPRKELLSKVQEGTLETRDVLGGPLHVRV